MRRLLQLTLFCLLAITTVIQTFAADPVYTVEMKKSLWASNSSYDGNFASKDNKWHFYKGNNDIGDYVRIGKKSTTQTSTLESKFKIEREIASVSFDILKWLRGKITAITVQVCPDPDFGESNTKTYSLTTMPTQEGEITIPIEKPVANQYYKINITCNNTTKTNGVIDIDWFKFYPAESSDSRQDVTLSWSESAVSANIGETFTAPTLTVNPADATSSLVYSSSDTSVAEIATDGTVTIKAVGQTTITAAIPDDNETYKPKSASYTLTVIDPNEVYYLVKTADDFDVTQECILVAYNGSYQAAMGAQGDGNYRSAVSYSSIDASLPDVLLAPAGTVPFTLEPGADSSTYYIKVGEDKYISVNTDDKTDTKEVAKSLASTVNLNINGTDHKASLKASGDTSTRALGYNNSANPKRFAYYSTKDATYNNVYLYQKRSATPALGDITFTPVPGEVTRGTEVTISCNNATQLYYIFSYEETGNGHFVTGNSTTVTITQDCSIEVIASKGSDQKTATASYTIKAAPLCGAISFDPASGSEVEEGSVVSISCENAVN